MPPYRWLKDVRETYQQKNPNLPLPLYILSKVDSERKFYPSEESKKTELISSLAKVVLDIYSYTITITFIKDDLSYNIFEQDLAILNIYFGKNTITGRYLFYINKL